MSRRAPDLSGLAQLMGSDKYSDLTFVCEGQKFKVHRAVVCTQSPVIAAACDGAFKVNKTITCPLDLGSNSAL
jgi:hypothetical protein